LALSIDIFLLLLIWALFSYALRLTEKCNMSVYITKLLDQNNLSWAFEQFGVTKIIGFDDNLTEEIVRQTGIKSLE